MNPDEQTAIKTLSDGGIGILPTGTIYGVVASATNQAAVERLYKLKKREAKPGTIIAASFQQLVDLGLEKEVLLQVSQFWPGPISIVIPAPKQLAYLHQNTNSLALRVVADQWVQDFLKQTGPLVTSSANHPGEPSATTIPTAKQYFGDDVDFYVDHGDLSNREASTIVALKDGKIAILREGAVKL